jgi:hypothetical protein
MSSWRDTICRFAWDYPVANISRNELRNCCRTSTSLVTPEDIARHGIKLFSEFEPLVEVKQALLRGERHEKCSSCWRVEEKGTKSARSGIPFFIELLRDIEWFGTRDFKEIMRRLDNLNEVEISQLSRYLDRPRMVEVSLSNTCDLKCVYCTHHYSSQWAAERLKYKDIPIHELAREMPKRNPEFLSLFWNYFDKVAFKTAEIVNFIGGEPLIIDEFYEYTDRILTKYEDPANQDLLPETIHIGIVTNLNTPPKFFKRLVDEVIPRILFNPRLRLDFNVSMESIGARAEYIRTGTDWSVLDNNIRTMLRTLNSYPKDCHSRIHFGFQVALNSLCISELPKFYQYVIDRQSEVDITLRLRPNQVVYPIWLSPHVLPVEYADYVQQSMDLLLANASREDDLHRFDKWARYVEFLETVKKGIENPEKDNGARHMFLREVKKLQDRRGIVFETTFPDMVPFYEQMKKDLL